MSVGGDNPVSELLEPISAGRMSGKIVAQISDLIRKGKLGPGDSLPPERELATTFGVSRVTVRDALRVLEVLGLVEIRVGSAGGAFVTAPSPEVLGQSLSNILMMRSYSPEEIAEVRLVIELGILDLVIERITEQDLEELRSMCEESAKRLEEGEYSSELSFAFHSRLARCANNTVISMISMAFSGPLSMAAMRAKEVRTDSHRRTVEEHRAIVDALASGDGEVARQHLVEHLLRGRAALDGASRLLRVPG
jgi:GntR family transcriptional repressor for pyruvate dehydrogenase complex